MKIIYSILLFSLNTLAFAQDNNMLAKIAFEDAETAFAAGKVQEAVVQLNKVDALLGTLMPKSQYLRVQIWQLAAEQNPTNIDVAVQNCKVYLGLAKSFDIPQDKQLDVTRTLLYFQKIQALQAQKVRDEKAALSLAKSKDIAFMEYSLSADWPRNITLNELNELKPETKDWKLTDDKINHFQLYHPDFLHFQEFSKEQASGTKVSSFDLPIHAAIVKNKQIIGYQRIFNFTPGFEFGYVEYSKWTTDKEWDQMYKKLGTLFGFDGVYTNPGNYHMTRWRKGTKTVQMQQYQIKKLVLQQVFQVFEDQP